MKVISPAELQGLLSRGEAVDIVDVREPDEWRTGHVPGARLVPLAQLKADIDGALPRDHIVFVCAKGGRSATAAQLAEQHGKIHVYSLNGGTEGWIAAQLPVVVPRPAGAPAGSSSATGAGGDDAPAADAIEPELHALVAANLKAQRARLGLSLDELARQAGVSRTLLGQIEIGTGVPSIGVIWKIAQTLGVPFSALLSTGSTLGTTISHRSTSKKLLSADGRFSSRALFALGNKAAAEFYELWLAPHSREDAEPHRRGTRENLIVTAGRLELRIGSERVVLEAGDSVNFAADIPHSYINPSGDECWMYLVMNYEA